MWLPSLFIVLFLSGRVLILPIKMDAVKYYAYLCRYTLNNDALDENCWIELHADLLRLRQALNCCVCARILHEPIGVNLQTDACQHMICLACKGGAMRIKPSCSWCSDHHALVRKPVAETLCQCYRHICAYLKLRALDEKLNSLSSRTHSQEQMLRFLKEATAEQPLPLNESPWMIFPDTHEPKVSSKKKKKAATSSAKRKSTSSDLTKSQKHIKFSASVTKDVNGVYSDSRKSRKKTVKVPEVDGTREGNVSDVILLNDSNSMPASSLHPRIEHDYNKPSAVRAHSDNSEAEWQGNHVELSPTISTEKPQQQEQSSATRNHKRGIVLRTSSKEIWKIEKPLAVQKRVGGASGCRCGLATPKPGNLTCCGQRCPCYASFNGCVDCQCRGCRNPRGDPSKSPLAALRLQRLGVFRAMTSPSYPAQSRSRVALQGQSHVMTLSVDDSDEEIDVGL